MDTRGWVTNPVAPVASSTRRRWILFFGEEDHVHRIILTFLVGGERTHASFGLRTYTHKRIRTHPPHCLTVSLSPSLPPPALLFLCYKFSVQKNKYGVGRISQVWVIIFDHVSPMATEFIFPTCLTNTRGEFFSVGEGEGWMGNRFVLENSMSYNCQGSITRFTWRQGKWIIREREPSSGVSSKIHTLVVKWPHMCSWVLCT